jgi:hypothetical protein
VRTTIRGRYWRRWERYNAQVNFLGDQTAVAHPIKQELWFDRLSVLGNVDGLGLRQEPDGRFTYAVHLHIDEVQEPAMVGNLNGVNRVTTVHRFAINDPSIIIAQIAVSPVSSDGGWSPGGSTIDAASSESGYGAASATSASAGSASNSSHWSDTSAGDKGNIASEEVGKVTPATAAAFGADVVDFNERGTKRSFSEVSDGDSNDHRSDGGRNVSPRRK